MSQKERIDRILVDRELVASRTRAQARLMAGDVFVDGQRVDQAGTKVPVDARIELKGEELPYVSRGGLKLEAALERFGMALEGKVAIDVGASTGGFTDCLLQRGVERVYAVDVGYGQLAWKLRQDPRVVVLERENIRHLEGEKVPEACDLAVIDCSFISLELVLPPTKRFLGEEGDVVALIKPQFEVGRDGLGKGGVVRDEEVREEAIERIISVAEKLGFAFVEGLDCPIHGPAGNIEYLAWLKRRRGDEAQEGDVNSENAGEVDESR